MVTTHQLSWCCSPVATIPLSNSELEAGWEMTPTQHMRQGKESKPLSSFCNTGGFPCCTSFCYMVQLFSYHLNGNFGFTGFMQVQQKANALVSFAFLKVISIDVITNISAYFFLMRMPLIRVQSQRLIVHEFDYSYQVEDNFYICANNPFVTSFQF